MQTGTLDSMARELPRLVINGAGDEASTIGIPALEDLGSAVRQQRASAGYRRPVRAIHDEAWTSNDD